MGQPRRVRKSKEWDDGCKNPTPLPDRRGADWRRSDAFSRLGAKGKTGGRRVWKAARRMRRSGPFIRSKRRAADIFPAPLTAEAGAFYRFRVNEAEAFHPDPASRFQPQGPHRSSCVVDPVSVPLERSGMGRGAIAGPDHLRNACRHLHAGRHLARPPRSNWRSWREIGITVIEMMPIADFPGEFGWGYDGVDLFAP